VRERERDIERGGQQMRVVLSAKLRAIYHYQTLAAETFHMTSNVSGVLHETQTLWKESEIECVEERERDGKIDGRPFD